LQPLRNGQATDFRTGLLYQIFAPVKRGKQIFPGQKHARTLATLLAAQFYDSVYVRFS